MQRAQWSQRGAGEREVQSSPRERRFLGQWRTLKELNQEHLESGLNETGPLGITSRMAGMGSGPLPSLAWRSIPVYQIDAHNFTGLGRKGISNKDGRSRYLLLGMPHVPGGVPSTSHVILSAPREVGPATIPTSPV